MFKKDYPFRKVVLFNFFITEILDIKMVFRSRAKLFERRKSLVKLTMKVLTRDGKIKEFDSWGREV